MKRLLVKTPGQLYIELVTVLEEAPGASIMLYFDNTAFGMYDALAYHDIISLFTAKLDLHVEVHYDCPTIFLAAVTAVSVENRHILRSVLIHFVREQRLEMGTVTDITIAGEQWLSMEETVFSLLSGGSGMEFEEVRKLHDMEKFITAEQAIEMGLIGGYLNG